MHEPPTRHAWRRIAALSSLVVCWAALGCTGAPGDEVVSTRALRSRFPAIATKILEPSPDHLVGSTHLAPGGQAIRHRTGLRASFPTDAEAAIRFELPGDFALEVRELEASGPTQTVDGAIAFGREVGRSYWTAAERGFEEWLHLPAGVARGNVVARWQVKGADLIQKGDAVELVDGAGVPRMRVTAPVAWAVDGAAVALKLHVEGQQLSLWVDARGAEVLVDPLWEPTGPMASGRFWHAATLLQTGKVLVTGGNSAQSTAELYDPSTGSWTATHAMSVGRDMHAQVVLPNGKVLVTGGQSPASLASAELYDPATGGWTPTGRMAQTRHTHAATLLPDGRVLVSGGWATQVQSLAESTSEIYDPATGQWSIQRTMQGIRTSHTAVLLADGRVLVSGGTSAAKSAEIYDPKTDTWTLTTPMNFSRFDHSLLLLANGRVLATGGHFNGANISAAEEFDPATAKWTVTGWMSRARRLHTTTLLPNGRVVAIGGDGALNSVEVYDPATGSWTTAGALAEGRQKHMATLLPSGKVLVSGGEGQQAGLRLSSSELFDPIEVRATTVGAATGRTAHSLNLLADGTVLAAGGFAATLPTASAQLYQPALRVWASTTPMHQPRRDHASVLLMDGQVLVAGGVSSAASNTAERYDPASKTWTQVGSMAEARELHTATVLNDGTALIAGGRAGAAATATAEVFDPSTYTWSATASMGRPRFGHIAVRLGDGTVLVAGGHDGAAALGEAERYHPATRTWMPAGALSVARQFATATLLPDGRVAVIGGVNAKGPQGAIDVYDPVTGVWSAGGALSIARSRHSATLLPGGKVLVVGGANTFLIGATELWDAETRQTSAGPTLTAARRRHRAVRLPTGGVLVSGGESLSSDAEEITELFEENRVDAAFAPTLTTVPDAAIPGASLGLQGTRFRGISTASGGLLSSASNHPLFVLTRDGGEGAWYLPVKSWTDISATVVVPAQLGEGHYWLSVVVNGAPGRAFPLRVGDAPQVVVGPPVFVQDANPAATVGQPYRYNEAGALKVMGTGPMTFSTCGAPVGFSVDATTGAVTWTPDTVGTTSVCVRAQNAAGQAEYVFTVEVTQGDEPLLPEQAFEVTLRSDLQGSDVPAWTEVELTAEVNAVPDAPWEQVWLKVELTGPATLLPADGAAESDLEGRTYRLLSAGATAAPLSFPVLVTDVEAGAPITVRVTIVDSAGNSMSQPSGAVAFTAAPMKLPYGCSCDASSGVAPWPPLLFLAAGWMLRRRQRSSQR